MKIWTCGSSPQSGSQNAWTRIKNIKGTNRLSNFWNFFVRRDPNDFLPQLVTMDKTWLYHYDLETKQQSMEWQHSGSPRPGTKNSECKNPLEKFSPWSFGIKTASSSLIMFQRAKLSTWNITRLCWCNWRTFWRKNATERSPKGLVLARQCPGSPGTCIPEETRLRGLPMSWSLTLFSGSGPVGLSPVPWTEKTIERSPFFVGRGYLVGRTTLNIFFFYWLAKVRAAG